MLHTVEAFGPFHPQELVIAPGDTVKWVGLGGYHTVTSYNGMFDSSYEQEEPKDTYEYTFTWDTEDRGPYVDGEMYHYYSRADENMRGMIIVEKPYVEENGF